MFGRCVHCSSISRILENLGLHPIHLSTGHSKRPRRAAGFSARPLEPAGHFSIRLAGGSSMVMSPLFFSDDFPHFSKKPPLCLGISTQIAMAQTATLPATRNWVNNWSCDWTHARRAICFRGFALWWLLRKHFALSNCTGSIGQQVHHVLEGFNLKGLCRSFEVSATGSYLKVANKISYNKYHS